MMEHAFTCFICSAYHEGEGNQRDHRVSNTTTHLTVCDDCVTVPLCSKNPTGIHGEVIDFVTIKEDGTKGRTRLDMPASVRQLPDYQVGVCSTCGGWLGWNADRMRWEAAA